MKRLLIILIVLFLTKIFSLAIDYSIYTNNNAYEEIINYLSKAVFEIKIFTNTFTDNKIKDILIDRANILSTCELIVKSNNIYTDWITQLQDAGIKIKLVNEYISGTLILIDNQILIFSLANISSSDFNLPFSTCVIIKDSNSYKELSNKFQDIFFNSNFSQVFYNIENFTFYFGKPNPYILSETSNIYFIEPKIINPNLETILISQLNRNCSVIGLVNDKTFSQKLLSSGGFLAFTPENINSSIYISNSKTFFFTSYLGGKYQDYSFYFTVSNDTTIKNFVTSQINKESFDKSIPIFIFDNESKVGLDSATIRSADDYYLFLTDNTGWAEISKPFYPVSLFIISKSGYWNKVINLPYDSTSPIKIGLDKINGTSKLIGSIDKQLDLFKVTIEFSRAGSTSTITKIFSGNHFEFDNLPTGEATLKIQATSIIDKKLKINLLDNQTTMVNDIHIEEGVFFSLIQLPPFNEEMCVLIRSKISLSDTSIKAITENKTYEGALQLIPSFTDGYLYKFTFKLPTGFTGMLKIQSSQINKQFYIYNNLIYSEE